MSNVPPSNVAPAKPPQRSPWGPFILLLSCVAVVGFANIWFLWLAPESRPLPKAVEGNFDGWRQPAVAGPEAPAEFSFASSSDALRETTIVPTLERAIPADKSAIWCATFPMAWQQLEKNILKKALRINGVEETCAELSGTPDARLDAGDYFVDAGFAEDDILGRIRRQLPKKFPNAPVDRLPELQPGAALAYARLEVALTYDFSFRHSDEPLSFKDSQSRATPVHAFGIREKDKDQGEHSFREQVLVLFRAKGEFALDLSRSTKPYQIILAKMARQANLKKTLDELNQRIAESAPKHLSSAAVVLVPSMNWKLEHRFRELEKSLIESAFQSIQFKMDRKGAYVASGAWTATLPNGHPDDPNPNHYLFDGPFLIVLKRRGHTQPFFVMWVDNAELLQKH